MKIHISGKDLATEKKVAKLKNLKQELEKNRELTALTFECFFKLEYYKDTGGRAGDVTIEYSMDIDLERQFKAITTILKGSKHITTLDLTGEHLSHGMVECLMELIKERPDLTLILDIEKIPTSAWEINGYPCYAPHKSTIEKLVNVNTSLEITEPEGGEDVIPVAEEVSDKDEGEVVKQELRELQDEVRQLREQLKNRKGWMSRIVALFCCCIPSFSRNRIRGKNTQNNNAKSSYVASGEQFIYLGAPGSGGDAKKSLLPRMLKQACTSSTKYRITGPKNLTY